MSSIEKRIKKELSDREKQNALRNLPKMDGLIDFCSNDYLGFSRSIELLNNVKREIENSCKSLGSTGSRLITGNFVYTEELEKKIAKFHNAESGLLYTSGYSANIGLLSAILKKGDIILYDEYSHASIRDGIRLSFAKAYSFQHNNIEHLENLLLKHEGNVFVILESIYSMDGDMSPIKEIIELKNKYKFEIIVDEAHSNGVFGKRGEGILNEIDVERVVFARVYTFGKALGCHGGIILGSKVLRQYLINYSRPFIYTTAMPMHSQIALSSAYDYLENNIEIINKLKKNINLFIDNISDIGFIESRSAIQALILPGNNKVKKIANSINNEGFDVRPILSPTVPEGKERIRICLHSFNTEEEILKLIEIIRKNI